MRLARRLARGFTVIEVLVVIAIIGVLLAILLPSLEVAREHANTVRCASNLSQIGLALSIYSNDNQGNFPRTIYQPDGPLNVDTGAASADPFVPGGPSPNDTSAPMFLLMRNQALPPALFADPYNDEIEYSPEPANLATHSNFTDWRKSLAYSYADPYPSTAAAAAGYRFSNNRNPTFPVMADMNPGTGPGQNSRNHERDGQNVLFADQHVEYERTTRCGINNDENYVNRAGVVQASPVDGTDTVLLPATP